MIAAVIAGAALLGGDGGGDEEDASGGEGSRPGRVDVPAIKRRVERMRGLRFRRPLAITFATPERAAEIIEKATGAEYSRRDTLIDEEELKLLGLLPPETKLERYLDAIEQEQVLGFYDDRSKRLVVVRDDSAGRALQEITLAHELVHALEDQHFGIDSREGFNDDGGVAEAALFEGTATALMVDYGTRYFDLNEALAVLDDVGGEETKLPPFIEDLLLFPYEQGERFISSLRVDGSWRAVDKVIRFRRPRTSEQVIHLDKYATGERALPVAIDGVGRTLGDGWRRLDRTSLGELDLRLLFEHVGDVGDPEASAGWGGGRFELWRTGTGSCPAPCVRRDAAVLELAWDSERDRVQGEAAFTKVFEGGLKGKRLAAQPGVGLWSSRGGAIGMRGRGRSLTVVLVPTAQLAARLLRNG